MNMQNSELSFCIIIIFVHVDKYQKSWNETKIYKFLKPIFTLLTEGLFLKLNI